MCAAEDIAICVQQSGTDDTIMAKTSTSKTIELEMRNGIALLWLNRPRALNALDATMVDEFIAAIDTVEAADDVRALVLAGRGDTFCSGGDIEWMQRMGKAGGKENERSAAAIAQAYHALYRCAVPTIARVHGDCFAGGVGLAAACDIAIASMNADFGCAEVKNGLVPAVIGPYVVNAIGRHAGRYLLTGEQFDAAEAYRIGLVHEICAPAELDGNINILLGHLVVGGPQAHRTTKALLREIDGERLDEGAVARAARRLAAARATGEAQEGMTAFLQKREPAWRAGVTGKKPARGARAKR